MSHVSQPAIEPWYQSLLNLLEHQQELVDQLDRLAQRQATLVSENRSADMLDVLSQRQAVIDQFSSCQRELGNISDDVELRLNELTTEHRDQIQSLVKEIGDRLSRIMKGDQTDHDRLSSLSDNSNQQVPHINVARLHRGSTAINGNHVG